MSNSMIKVNYDELAQIAKQFHAESEDYTQLNSRTQQQMDNLRSEWRGDAANAFFNEMNNRLIPSIKRLASALLTAEKVTYQIMQIIHDADDETTSYFKGLDFGADGTPKKTRVYLINGIDYQNDNELKTLQNKLMDKYGKNVDVIIVGAHPYDSKLQQYTSAFSTHFGGLLSPVDWLTGKVANVGLTVANKALGLAQVIDEYKTGGGPQSQKVFQWIQEDMAKNGLIGDSNVNVVLVNHSGAGAIAANIVDDIEQKLGVNVSGMVTMGSPFSNFDHAAQYADHIVDIRNQSDGFGSALGFGALRSDENRQSVFGGLFHNTDPSYRDPAFNVRNVTTDDGISPWNWLGGHNSYWSSNSVVDAIGSILP